MTLARVTLGLTVAGLVLAGIAVLVGDRAVTWVAIGFLAAAFLLRRVLGWRGSP